MDEFEVEEAGSVSKELPVPEVLTLDEAADLLRISTRTLKRLAISSQVPGRRVGQQWRFNREQLLRWVSGPDLSHFTSEPRKDEDE